MTKQNLEKCLMSRQETYSENPDLIGDIPVLLSLGQVQGLG